MLNRVLSRQGPAGKRSEKYEVFHCFTGVFFTGRSSQNTGLSHLETYCGWTKSCTTLKHDTICLLVFTGELSLQGILGGAKCISSIHSMAACPGVPFEPLPTRLNLDHPLINGMYESWIRLWDPLCTEVKGIQRERESTQRPGFEKQTIRAFLIFVWPG